MSYDNNVKFPEVHLEYPGWVRRKVDWLRPRFGDRDRMRTALDVAHENVLQTGGLPFGAAIFDDTTGMLLAVGMNCVDACGSSVMHAEVVAIMLTQAKLGRTDLGPPGKCALYSSCEPCVMCLGAILWSGIPRVVWSARQDDADRAGFPTGLSSEPLIEQMRNGGITLDAAVLRDEGRALLDSNRQRRS
jgi:tRNA(Arg) A34 adenosine deaminase TadA